MKTMKRLFITIIGGMITVYFITAMIFIPYYNWKYANTHGFIQWIFTGAIVATAKGVAWPYFFFLSSDSDSASHVIKALEYSDEAVRIINKGETNQQVPQSDIDAVLNFYTKALQEAKKADIESMNKDYPGFGDHFKNEFITGLELFIKSIETKDPSAAITSHAMLNNWRIWFNANLESIRDK